MQLKESFKININKNTVECMFKIIDFIQLRYLEFRPH